MSACLHVTAETANLARTLKAGGADLCLIASNPLSTQDDVAASLVQDFGITVYAIHGEDTDTYYKHIAAALEHEPHVTMDDGADLVSSMIFVALDRLDDVHAQVRDWAAKISPAERENALRPTSSAAWKRRPPASSACGRWRRTACSKFPVIAVNDAQTKHFFDNRYGTGQSTIDGIIRATNMLLAGRKIVVAATAGAARAWPAGPAAWALRSSSPRSIRSRPSKRRWTASPSCRWPRPPRSATSSSPSPATSTSSAASTSRR